MNLKKRRGRDVQYDTIKIVKETEEVNGVTVVRDAIENLYLEGRDTLTTVNLLDVVKEISTSLKDKISQIKSSLEKFDIMPSSRSDK